MEYQLTTLFLVASLFVPRISILVMWLQGMVPPNPVPWLGDLLLSIFFPRVLILIYIGFTMGFSTPWFWVHLIFALIAYTGGTRTATKHRR